MRVQDLSSLIRQILTSPDTDLRTVSAKRVRKRLVELNPEVTSEFIKENKEELDKLIGSIFESLEKPGDLDDVGTEGFDHSNGPVNGKRKREVKEEEEYNGDPYQDQEATSPPPPLYTKKAKKEGSQKLTDEEYARMLSSELNQRPARGSRQSNGGSKKSATRSPKKRKSRAEIDDSDDDDDGEETGGKRRKSKSTMRKAPGEAKGGFAKELALSEPLAVVVEADHLSRPQVVKKLWEYIKRNDLQNPRNKKEILCDPLLKAVFNVEKIDMFAMNKVLSQHLYEPDA